MESASINTPAFLLWAIEYSCPVRGFQNGSDPDHTERQLRAAMALSAARREGRIFEGYCVDPPLGFRIEEALAIYGGLETVERTCGTCPANAVRQIRTGELAGCMRMLVLPENKGDFYRRVDEAVERAGLAEECSRLFPNTQPRWQGFWVSSALSHEQVSLLANVMSAIEVEDCFGEQVTELHAGLCVARDNRLAFHAILYPRGSVERNWWRLVPHCPRCKADWKASGRGRCNVCGYVGHAAPEKKRRARGRRPYLPLARLIGEGAAGLLERFETK